ncbi:hypothetical protein D3C71_2078840 [compost metagenome]
MGETQQAAEAQFAETRVQGLQHFVKIGEHLCFVQRLAMVFQQRLQRRPDAGVPIHQDLIAVDQQRPIFSQPHL